MRSKIVFILRYYIFWLALAILSRTYFLCYVRPDSLGFNDICRAFWHGFRLDMSLGGYMTALAAVVVMLFGFLRADTLRRILNILTGILLGVFWLVVLADAEIFANWGYHMDASVLTYLKTPKEALASTSTWLFVGLLLLYALFWGLSGWFYKRSIASRLQYAGCSWWHSVVMLLICGVLVIPIRGGFNVAPMNTSFVFFHKTNMVANFSAVNGVWNFIYELSHAGSFSKKYEFIPKEEAHRLVDAIYHSENKGYKNILKVPKPNVVVLLLESFSADAVEALGGESGVTPRLNGLIKEGILFDNIYATGNRSDRGIAGVISGQPSHPNFALIKYPSKMVDVPRFPMLFEEAGYHTRFYYAGDLNFGGFRSYITMSFNEMVTEDDFDGEAIENRFKWGVHDEYMFKRLAEDAGKGPSPFMYMAFNMSSHEPFDVPMATQIAGTDEDRRMLNAIYYADQSLGIFVDILKINGLWDNTLLVLVADHSTIKIKKWQSYRPEAFRIPFVLSGGALAVRDTVVHTLGSQTDVAATLLSQLHLPTDAFKYSKNLLAEEVSPFAFYAFSNTAGIVTENGASVLNLRDNSWIMQTDTTDQTLLKAYLQVLDDDVN